MRSIIVFMESVIFLFLMASSVAAHVVVKPGEVGIGSFQTFVIAVPVEKDVPTVGLRLLMPEGLENVMPNVKPGWNIRLATKNSADQNGRSGAKRQTVTEIEWTGGIIPAGQRDDFLFSAKAPAAAGVLQWRAYQTYEDGTVVAWDRAANSDLPKTAAGRPDFSKSGPFSQTRVLDDLRKTTSNVDISLWISGAAFLMSVASLFIVLLRRRTGIG